MIITHHSDLLRLLQYVVDFVGAAIEYDVCYRRILNLLQQWSEIKDEKWSTRRPHSPLIVDCLTGSHSYRAIAAPLLEIRMVREP